MSTTFDAVAGTQANSSSFSWSHTSAGNFLVVSLAIETNGSNPVTAITCNGSPLTISPAGWKTSSSSTGLQIGGVQYYLANPGTGTLAISVTLNATLNAALSSVTTTGSNTLLTEGAAGGASGDSHPTLTLPLASGSLTVLLISTPEVGPQWVNPASPTQYRNAAFGGLQNYTYGISGLSGSQNINLTWSGAQNGGWVMSGLVIGQPVGAGFQTLRIYPGWGKRVN